MIKDKPRVEGYWYSKHDPDLPKPEIHALPFKKQTPFLNKLGRLERRATEHYYKGWSTCRICGKHNGSTEYELGKWRWPYGFSHYVADHNLRPSRDFYDFVMSR